jgi:hypothetical protein
MVRQGNDRGWLPLLDEDHERLGKHTVVGHCVGRFLGFHKGPAFRFPPSKRRVGAKRLAELTHAAQ